MPKSSEIAECPSAALPKLIFAGFTLGVVGSIVPVFAQLSPDRAVTIQAWLAAGANGAAFTITNDYGRPIRILPIARIRNGGACDEAPLLNAPNFSGIPVEPGQSCSVQIAMIARQAPWQVLF